MKANPTLDQLQVFLAIAETGNHEAPLADGCKKRCILA